MIYNTIPLVNITSKTTTDHSGRKHHRLLPQRRSSPNKSEISSNHPLAEITHGPRASTHCRPGGLMPPVRDPPLSPFSSATTKASVQVVRAAVLIPNSCLSTLGYHIHPSSPVLYRQYIVTADCLVFNSGKQYYNIH